MKKLLPIPILDLIFVFSLTYVFERIFIGSEALLNKITGLVQQQQEFLQTNNMIELIKINEQIETEYKGLISMAILLIAALYVIWTATQTFVWYLLAKEQKLKTKLPTFALKSAISNLVGILLLSVFLILLSPLIQTDPQKGVTIITTAAVLLCYLLFTAYAAAAIPWKKVRPNIFKRTIAPFIGLVIALKCSFALIRYAVTVSPSTATLAIILVALPVYTIARRWLMHDAHAKKTWTDRAYKKIRSYF